MHTIVIIIAKYFIVLSPLLLAYVWLRLPRSEKRQAILIGIIGAVITMGLALIGKKLFNDPRPFVAGHFTPYFPHSAGNGFPSDHTLLAGFVASLTLLYSKRFGVLAFVIALLIGVSRVIAGVHHIVDIIGSLVFAGLGVWLAWLITKRLSART